MYVFDFDADQAFDLMASLARSTRVDVSRFAAQLIDDVVALLPEERVDLQLACGRLLLTVHQRIKDVDDD